MLITIYVIILNSFELIRFYYLLLQWIYILNMHQILISVIGFRAALPCHSNSQHSQEKGMDMGSKMSVSRVPHWAS